MISLYQGPSRFSFFFKTISSLCIAYYHDHVPGAPRKWIPAHHIYIIYSPHPQWTFHGCSWNYNMVTRTLYWTTKYTNSFSPLNYRHPYMVISEVVTLFFYIISIAFLPAYFGAFVFFTQFRHADENFIVSKISPSSSHSHLHGKLLLLWPLVLFHYISWSLSTWE